MSADGRRFAWPIRVYYEDTDAGGVVQHAQYVKYLERARTEWLRSLGVEQDKLMAAQGIIFVVSRIDLRYHRPARFNDALLVTVSPVGHPRARLLFEQTVARAGEEVEPLASAAVEVACVDRASFRPRRLPQILVSGMDP